MTSARRLVALVVAAAMLGLGPVSGQGRITEAQVSFPALDGKTELRAYLLRPADEAVHAALVLLHGCTGLQTNGRMFAIYRVWARLFAVRRYATLVVDSAGSRGFGETCTRRPERRVMFEERPKDAYAALKYLQAQPFVQPDRVGVIGWSQGGATILLSIGTQSRGRPQPLNGPDFRAAVAFYPGLCDEHIPLRPNPDVDPAQWRTTIPLLVLQGAADNWTPAAPCEAFIAAAQARGSPVEFKLYPNAHHVFDAPHQPLHPLPQFRRANGVVPIAGTDVSARGDALPRVLEFFEQHLAE